MKVVTVVGARPQFIKAAVVSHELRKKHREILVHTGQHYDDNMSGQFFRELDLTEADYNLGISGGTHAVMTGRMMAALEEVFLKEQPDWLLVYGDTNSTLAAALCGAKLHIVAWPETMTGNRNQLSGPDAGEIREKLFTPQTVEAGYQPFGDGHAARKIVRALEEAQAHLTEQGGRRQS